MNPFLLTGYHSREYFCDRQKETERITEAIQNARNLTLISERRLGKTTLLNHVEHNLDKSVVFIYVDLYPTLQLKDFVQVFSNRILSQLEPFSDKVMRKINSFFGLLRPRFSIDPATGAPNLELSLTNRSETETSVSLLFDYIRQSEKRVAVAFDEFQQIQNYPEKNVEALLRSLIQKDTSSSFIFSGSYTHMLISMFSDYSRPFYQSSELMQLDKIDRAKYVPFILSMFGKGKIRLSESTAEYLYDLNKGITYNVQYICNKLFSSGNSEISKINADEILKDILEENEVIYFNYRELMTDLQFKVLKAIAKETSVDKPYSNQFISKYQLGSSSSVKTVIDALLKRGMLTNNRTIYVTDWYFSLWLKNQL